MNAELLTVCPQRTWPVVRLCSNAGRCYSYTVFQFLDEEYLKSLPSLEEVYKTSRVPTYTFVKPAEYHRMIVGLRTPGRGLIVEGPSGIGKTAGILKALEELGLAPKTLNLSARKIAG